MMQTNPSDDIHNFNKLRDDSSGWMGLFASFNLLKPNGTYMYHLLQQ
jgi:hypothetical protein